MRRSTRDRGFTLVELLLATALTLVVLSAALALIETTAVVSQALPDAADQQARARAALDALWRDAASAGAGEDAGAWAGPLVQFFAPVIPRRIGLSGADAPTTARDDAIAFVTVPRTLAQTTLALALASGASTATVAVPPSCPTGQPMCGLLSASRAVVFDGEGAFDLFAVTGATGATGTVAHMASAPAAAYGVGAAAAAVDVHVYYFDRPNAEFRLYDGYLSDVPIIDNVVGVTFAYFGDPDPLRAPKPPVGIDNCLFDVTGAPKTLATLGPPGALVPLPLSIFEDGPWCGEGDTRYDADLLRIRRVRVTIRLGAAAAWLRGRGPSFVAPGTALDPRRQIQDYVVTFDVTPRNLGGPS